MDTPLQNLLEDLEAQGKNELKDLRQLAPLLVFLIQQEKENGDRIAELLEEIRKKEFPATNLNPVVDALGVLIKKEIKFPETKFPDVQKVRMEKDISIPDHGLAFASQEILLKEILEVLRDLKNEEKTIVIENKMPVDRRPFALPVTGMGDAEFRKYKSRYMKRNVKPQEGTSDPGGSWALNTRTVFTLIHLPEVGTDQCKVGGATLIQSENDYTLVGQTVTFTLAPTAQPYFDYDVI